MNMERSGFKSGRSGTGLYAYVLCTLLLGGLADSVSAADATAGAVAGGKAEAVEQLQKDGKFICVLMYKENNAKLKSFQDYADILKKNQVGRVEVVQVDTQAAAAGNFLKKYRIDPARMPMPLLMVVAPNGAVTGMFANELDEKKLAASILSETAAQCLKLLQDGKNVVLCLQGEATKGKEQIMEAVNAFLADKAYKDTFDKVIMDPSKPEDKAFLEKLKVTVTTDEAVTVVLTSQGKIAGTFKGATSKAQLVKAMKSCSSGCAPGSS